MLKTQAREEYVLAHKEAQREYKECVSRGLNTSPAVLDDILDASIPQVCVDVGIVNIPITRIIGTKTAGRISAFTPQFRPLLSEDSEFGQKWIHLCMAHLGDEGIQAPIECFEYWGNFYVQEGNKRVSVLRHFGATQIAGKVKRILPVKEDTPRYKAYQEFVEFYKRAGLYDLQFQTPGSYSKLLAHLQYATDHVWTEKERRQFRSRFYCFCQAIDAVAGKKPHTSYEDSLLMWLEVYPFSDLRNLTSAELKKTITQMWPNLMAASDPDLVVKTEPPENKTGLVQMLKGVDHLKVAFIHQYSQETSNWTMSHEAGRLYLEKALGSSVTTKAYFNTGAPENADEQIELAVAEGAQVVFTTATQLVSACMRASVKYPKVRFLNCSLHQGYASLRPYYGRIHEGKFITGAIAGAMCENNRIGYIGNYPIFGEPASINAFALGAQLTNPKARIELKWSCTAGNPTQEFLNSGIRVISNRNTPLTNHLVNEYGTYMADDDGKMIPLGSPTWVWGQFYENMVRSIMRSTWEHEKEGQIMNLWWGMSSGVIDVALASELPEGIQVLAQMLRNALKSGLLDPFARKIIDQQGTVRNDGTRTLSAQELLQMDWLCENVEGSFPTYDELLPQATPMVDLLGLNHSRKDVGVL